MKLQITNQPRTIFLAEDDEDDCLIFLEALQELKSEVEVIVSRDGVELMENLDKRIPPIPYVLFLDLNMPLENGFNCLKEIKQINKLKDMPIVILSTSIENEDIRMAYKLGANYYMRKPDRFSQLVEGIEQVLFSSSFNSGPTPFNKFILLS